MRPENAELILGHRATYTNTITGELVSKVCLHTCVHRKNGNTRSTGTQDCRTDNPQSEIARSANINDNQVAKSKHKNIAKRNKST